MARSSSVSLWSLGSDSAIGSVSCTNNSAEVPRAVAIFCSFGQRVFSVPFSSPLIVFVVTPAFFASFA
jgi:hypothetical protein